MSLRDAWEQHAADWVEWARAPDHDTYWRFHRDGFFALVPPPGRRTLDMGCGEGRVSRDLAALGHRVVGVDLSLTLVRAARDHPQPVAVARADAACLPFADHSFDLVVAFMTLHDMDEPASAVSELARVLQPGGQAAVAVVHPINSAGEFVGDRGTDDRPFVINGSYLAGHRYEMEAERDGRSMTFVSQHHSLAAYSRMIEPTGLLIEALREPPTPDPADRWSRVPLFLHLCLVKPS